MLLVRLLVGIGIAIFVSMMWWPIPAERLSLPTLLLELNLWKGTAVIIVYLALWDSVAFLHHNHPAILPAIKFRLTFGIWPKREPGGPVEAWVVQELVDRKLARLAEEFFQVCNEEQLRIKLLRRDLHTQNTNALKRNTGELRKTRERLRERKKRFWQAHALAKSLNYEVDERVKDHIKDPEILARYEHVLV